MLLLAFSSCQDTGTSKSQDSGSLSVAFEKYELENGLDVILHQDKSDPIVSVAIQYAVGSNREKNRKDWICAPF
jgi:zinc protease